MVYFSSAAVLPDLSSTCNSGCGCHTELHEPVCDVARGVQYFSPCHAGCKTRDEDGKVGATEMLFTSTAL